MYKNLKKKKKKKLPFSPLRDKDMKGKVYVVQSVWCKLILVVPCTVLHDHRKFFYATPIQLKTEQTKKNTERTKILYI